jgi:hypothetical protein
MKIFCTFSKTSGTLRLQDRFPNKQNLPPSGGEHKAKILHAGERRKCSFSNQIQMTGTPWAARRCAYEVHPCRHRSAISSMAIDCRRTNSMSRPFRGSRRPSPQFVNCDWAAIASERLPVFSTRAATALDAALSGGSNPLCARSTRAPRKGRREWHNVPSGDFSKLQRKPLRNLFGG